MGKHDHWHPVALSRELKSQPLRIRFHGQNLCLFRTGSGGVGALADRCAHRGMSLSRGKVVGERVQCPYHGWCYGADGCGESPGAPRLQVQTESYEVREHKGTIWIQPAGASAAFPTYDVEDFQFVRPFRHRVQGSLSVVLDNFSEVEHTPTTHAIFGYPMEKMAEVVVDLDLAPDAVTVTNRGPQRPLPWWVQMMMGISAGDLFVDRWTTRFSPVYSVFDHWWEEPTGGEQRPGALRVSVFFTPVDEETTDLFTFLYAQLAPGWRTHLFPLFKPLMNYVVDREIRCDQELIGAMDGAQVEMRGMKLSRFDKALAENRKRIVSIYEGSAAFESSPPESTP